MNTRFAAVTRAATRSIDGLLHCLLKTCFLMSVISLASLPKSLQFRLSNEVALHQLVIEVMSDLWTAILAWRLFYNPIE